MSKRKKPLVRAEKVSEPASPYALRRWRAGMRLMNEMTAREMRALTEKEKSRQIEELFESGRSFRWPDRSEEDAEVWRRWNRIREVLSARS